MSRLLVRSRPRFWLYLAGPVLVGLAYGAETASDLSSPVAIALFGYFLLPANVYLYGVNDVFDADVDATNPKKDARESRYRGDRLTVVATVASGTLGVALLVLGPRPAAPWIAGFLVLGAAYSAPPVRLKVRPPLDSLSNGLYVLPGAAAYVALAGSQPPIAAVVGGWLWTMGMHTFSAIPDIGPDRRAGIRTLATMLGERHSLAYCGGCWLLAAVSFAALDVRAGLLVGSFPLLLGWIARSEVAVDRAYWWFPAINAAVGAVLTVGGLWGFLGG